MTRLHYLTFGDRRWAPIIRSLGRSYGETDGERAPTVPCSRFERGCNAGAQNSFESKFRLVSTEPQCGKSWTLHMNDNTRRRWL